MEDYLFVRRLRRFGNIRITVATSLTSARRWKRLGVIRTALINQLMIIGLRLQISPGKLISLYHRAQSATKPEKSTSNTRKISAKRKSL